MEKKIQVEHNKEQTYREDTPGSPASDTHSKTTTREQTDLMRLNRWQQLKIRTVLEVSRNEVEYNVLHITPRDCTFGLRLTCINM